MIRIQGQWFDGNQSKRTSAEILVVDSGQFRLQSGDEQLPLLTGQWSDLVVEERLGNTTRTITTEIGVFETRDNDQVDQCQRQFSQRYTGNWLHVLEQRWRFVALSLVVLVAFAAWLYWVALPKTAAVLAQHVPEKVLNYASQQTLSVLDKHYVAPSKLTEQTQQDILNHFQPLLDQYNSLKPNVLFRDGKVIGANAFALPNGTIVFTDQIVALADNYDQLMAVMAHELGHVHHQHGMQQVVHGSLLTFLIMAWTGDVSASAEIVLTIPVVLSQMSFSRNHETEADQFAFDYLQASGQPRHFADMMLRLQGSFECGTSLEDELQKAIDHHFADKDGDSEIAKKEDVKKGRKANKSSDDALTDNKETHHDGIKGDVNSNTDVAEGDDASTEPFSYSPEMVVCIDRYVSDFHQQGDLPQAEGDETSVWNYLSTHPATRDRIQQFLVK